MNRVQVQTCRLDHTEVLPSSNASIKLPQKTLLCATLAQDQNWQKLAKLAWEANALPLAKGFNTLKVFSRGETTYLRKGETHEMKVLSESQLKGITAHHHWLAIHHHVEGAGC